MIESQGRFASGRNGPIISTIIARENFVTFLYYLHVSSNCYVVHKGNKTRSPESCELEMR